MPTSKPITDRIARLKAQMEEKAAKLNQLEAKAKKDAEKRETRRRIVIGEALLAHLAADAAFAGTIKPILERYVTRPADQDILADILNPPPPAPAAVEPPAVPAPVPVAAPVPATVTTASTETRAPAWGEMPD